MTNYEHYQSTVEQVDRAIHKEANAPWHIEYHPAANTCPLGVRQSVNIVSPSGIVCQQLALDADIAQSHWPDKSMVDAHVLDYVVRGAARLAPLRQTAFRNNFPHWLAQCLQQVHLVLPTSERLTGVLTDPAFPYPSQVNLDGIYLPCWVWRETNEAQVAISVIDRRTGYFSPPRTVLTAQLVDREKWLGAQVIDSVGESIETVRHYVAAHIREQHKTDFDEPSISEAFRHPCAATLSPFMSVGLVMLVVIGFFITFKWVLGF